MITKNAKFGITWTIWVVGVIGLLGLFSFTGCESRPPLEELGELEFAVPDLPGIDDPYPIPDVGNGAEKSAGSEQPETEP